MNFTINVDNLEVTIKSKGAEISSILFNGLEYIWQAKPIVWPRHTPVLFPIVGKLKENIFTYNNISYSLPQHGFARDKEFRMVDQKPGEITFELRSDDETKKVFPFEFKFLITYKISNNEVFCNYSIVNPSSTNDLCFSIGAHPGFKIPLVDGEKFTDYSILFEPNKKFMITTLSNGLLTDHKKELQLVNGGLKVTTNLFDNDALVFEDSQIDKISLRSNISGKGIEMNCENWPYFGIWSKQNCNEFICLEPWHGIADSINSSGDLKNKKGIINLKPQENFDCGFSIKLF